jgi:Kef-type K+ transport system membrane component KefB
MLKKVENEEDAYFVVMLSIMTIAGVLAAAIQLPDIAGAFLAGLAVNASARDAPASAKLQFLGKSLFIPIFFVVTGFLVNPITFVYGTLENFLLVASIVGALLFGKEIAGRGCGSRIWLQSERTTNDLVAHATAWLPPLPRRWSHIKHSVQTVNGFSMIVCLTSSWCLYSQRRYSAHF